MLNMMQEQIVLCKQGMLCWREPMKAIAAVMGTLGGDINFSKVITWTNWNAPRIIIPWLCFSHEWTIVVRLAYSITPILA